MLLVVLCAIVLSRSRSGAAVQPCGAGDLAALHGFCVRQWVLRLDWGDVRRGQGCGRHRRAGAAQPDAAGAGGRVAPQPRRAPGAQPLRQRDPWRAAREEHVVAEEPRRVSNGVIIVAMLLPSASSASSRPDTAPPPSVRCVRAFVRHLSSLPFPSCVWRWWGLRLTLLWCGSCRQARGPAPGADELQHPDGAGGVVAGQDARRSVCSAPRIKSSSRESNLSEIQPPHCLR